MTKDELRGVIQGRLDEAIAELNRALQGQGVDALEPVLSRVGRGGRLPHWYEQLRKEHTLPNLDGKTIGSVIEMLFMAVLETRILKGLVGPLKINPARGVDFPDLDLSVKAPSENFCTSEPFFSAYERLLGGEHEVLVLLTDYQSQKARPPLRLQIRGWKYLHKTQVADFGLCVLARKHKAWLLETNEAWAQKVFRFLAYVNQSDWRARHLLRIFASLNNEKDLRAQIALAEQDFTKQNLMRTRADRLPIVATELDALTRITTVSPIQLGVVDAVDNWVVEVHKDFGRLPNENEWQRLKSGPLDGMIGMSYALQWRYNFGRLFGVTSDAEPAEQLATTSGDPKTDAPSTAEGKSPPIRRATGAPRRADRG